MDREGETDSKREMYVPYRAALNNDWESVKDFYKKYDLRLSYPITASKDNAFHLATFSKRKEPLQSLLDISESISESNPMMRYGYLETNGYGNTPLHEAAANGNLEAVQALVNHHQKLSLEDFGIEDENELLEAENTKGETPLFIAAAFGSTEVVKFLASKSLKKSIRVCFKLKEAHRQHIGLINVEPESDASNRLSRVIQSEIILKPKPDASTQLSSAIRGEIILEPKRDASDQLSSAIQGEITLEPKPDALNQLSGAIRGEIILKPKPGATQKETSKKEPDVSTQLSSAIRGEIILEPKRDASDQLSSAIQGEITLEPKPDALNQLSGAIRGEIILKPKPGATQKETSKKEPDVSTQLSSAIRGEIMLEAKPDAPNQPFGAIRGKIILEPKPSQKRGPDASILHVAIAGHHFETALYLLNQDESLATVRDLKGWTSLHLLATMPAAFESGYRWGTWIHRVLYFCKSFNESNRS
ncbi:uncharacterized protein LOC123192140 [Mangifera indica]|uniref:uncharacterized protein LOC123192140 n=1 Tax=Mangifera indica TaxID=29780 RepID=UPI001CFBBDF5|nr:uncharacterized protein LOC123192140 [Mangifera indica]